MITHREKQNEEGRLAGLIYKKIRRARRMKTYYVHSMVSLTKRTGERIMGKIDDIADLFDQRSYIKVNGQEYSPEEFEDKLSIFWEGNQKGVMIYKNA